MKRADVLVGCLQMQEVLIDLERKTNRPEDAPVRLHNALAAA